MAKLTVADYMKRNPALKRIAEMLERSFNEIGEKIREDLINGYENHARNRFEQFITTVPTMSGKIEKNHYTGGWKFDDWPEWAEYKRPKESYYSSTSLRTWDDYKKDLGLFTLTLKPAREKANRAYEGARDSFVYKNLDKIAEVLGKRSDLKNGVINFNWDPVGRYFKGNLQLYLENVYFRGELDVKYVVRTIPNLTPYFQYPLVFTEAEVNGKHYARPSELELRNLISGKTSEQHEAERQAQKLAEGFCPGSGKEVPSEIWRKIYNMYIKSAKCPDCGQIVSAQHAKYRQHKTKAAVKLSAAQKLTEAGYCPMSREKVPAEIVAAMPPVEGYKDPKAPCPSCGQQVRLDSRRDWIRDQHLSATGHPTRMKVESATYYKHKLAK